MYKKQRQTEIMTELRYTARHCSNPNTLLMIAKRYRDDIETCTKLLSNKAIDGAVEDELSKNSHIRVRVLLAQRGEHISSIKAQTRLAMDSEREVKKHLARTTTKEEIKELIFKSTPESPPNEEIRGICLKRIHNMNLIERFMLTSKKLFEYGQYILQNKHLTSKLLITFVTLCSKLDETLVNMVREHPSYDCIIEDAIRRTKSL